MIVMAIDNGVSGCIAVLDKNGDVLFFDKTPTIKTLNYTKKKSFITRVDTVALKHIIKMYEPNIVLLERPMVNPKRYGATVSAIRADEATWSVLNEMGVRYEYVDSKQWQKVMLPKGTKAGETKVIAKMVGKRMFPKIETNDYDALLMAEWGRTRGR